MIKWVILYLLAGYALGNLSIIVWSWIDFGKNLEEQPWYKKAVAFIFWPYFTCDVFFSDFPPQMPPISGCGTGTYLFSMTIGFSWIALAEKIIVGGLSLAILAAVSVFYLVFHPPWIKS